MISYVKINDLEESIAASGLPMAESDKQYEEELALLKDFFKDKRVLTADQIDRATKCIQRFVRLSKTKSGEGHDCALKGVSISFNCTKTQSFDHQMQRYNWINYVSSMSTMHRALRMDLSESSHVYVSKDVLTMLEILKSCYLKFEELTPEDIKEVLATFNITAPKELTKKALFEIIIMNIPSGLKLTVRVTTNYMQLKTIYKQRRNHKMTEWQHFCDWIATLPLMSQILDIKK